MTSSFSKTSMRFAILAGVGVLAASTAFGMWNPARQAPAPVVASQPEADTRADARVDVAAARTPSAPETVAPTPAGFDQAAALEALAKVVPLDRIMETVQQPEFAGAMEQVADLLALDDPAKQQRRLEDMNAELRAMDAAFRDRLRQIVPPRPRY